MENKPKYIDKAIDRGYNVEVDIRGSFVDGLFLGHDEAQYEVSPEWILREQNICGFIPKIYKLFTHSHSKPLVVMPFGTKTTTTH